MKFLKNKRFGFTLIELLIVIAIIGILTAIILPALQTARKKGREAQRVSDLKEVQASLEFYYAANHSYPTTGGAWYGMCASGNPTSVVQPSANAVIPGLAPTYIAAVPTDPQESPSSSANCYLYNSDGTNWAFIDNNTSEMLITQSAPNYNDYPELIDPARDSNGSPTAWKVSSAGALSW